MPVASQMDVAGVGDEIEFTEKVFALVKKIRAAGMQITDEEISGVLFLWYRPRQLCDSTG